MINNDTNDILDDNVIVSSSTAMTLVIIVKTIGTVKSHTVQISKEH